MHLLKGSLTTAAAAVLAAVSMTGCGSGPEKAAAPTSSTSSSSAPSLSSSSSSSSSSTTSAPTPKDATAVASGIKGKVPTVTKLVTITEDNDPNNKIGRPGGYVSAATLYDSGATCSELGVECGATVEVWPDEADATARSKFIQDALKAANGALGTEYHYQDGPVLLRVYGDLKPSVAKKYEAAFKD